MPIPLTYMRVQILEKKVDVPIYPVSTFPNSPLRINTVKGIGTFELVAPTMEVRYIRSWAGESNISIRAIWNEIQAIDFNGTNVALNKNTTSSPGQLISNASHANDGILSSSQAGASITGTPGNSYYVQVDLGSIIPLKEIIISHFPDGRTFTRTKLEVSTNGTNWNVLFDSAISGTYAEPITGKKYEFSLSPIRVMTATGAKSLNLEVDIENIILLAEGYTLKGPNFVTVTGTAEVSVSTSRSNTGISYNLVSGAMLSNRQYRLIASILFEERASVDSVIRLNLFNVTKSTVVMTIDTVTVPYAFTDIDTIFTTPTLEQSDVYQLEIIHFSVKLGSVVYEVNASQMSLTFVN